MRQLTIHKDKECRNTEIIYFPEEYTIEDIKDNARYSDLHVYSEAIGNFGTLNLFCGRYDDFVDFLCEEKNEEMINGYIHFTDESTNLNMSNLKAYINETFNR